jgi:AcrR family transcriptional regulator
VPRTSIEHVLPNTREKEDAPAARGNVMIIAEKQVSTGKDDRIPPRERILAVAADLFYRHGIRAVGVESIAEAAGTNKMTLYRHFASKDELVAEYLRRLANKASSSWDRLAAAQPGNPRAQLRGWLSVPSNSTQM